MNQNCPQFLSRSVYQEQTIPLRIVLTIFSLLFHLAKDCLNSCLRSFRKVDLKDLCLLIWWSLVESSFFLQNMGAVILAMVYQAEIPCSVTLSGRLFTKLKMWWLHPFLSNDSKCYFLFQGKVKVHRAKSCSEHKDGEKINEAANKCNLSCVRSQNSDWWESFWKLVIKRCLWKESKSKEKDL